MRAVARPIEQRRGFEREDLTGWVGKAGAPGPGREKRQVWKLQKEGLEGATLPCRGFLTYRMGKRGRAGRKWLCGASGGSEWANLGAFCIW